MYVPEGARIWHRQGPVHRREQVLVPTSEEQITDSQHPKPVSRLLHIPTIHIMRVHTRDATDRAAHRPGRFESLELLQEGGKLLLLRWRQVPQSRLFPEPTLLEGAAVDRKTGMRASAHTASAHLYL